MKYNRYDFDQGQTHSSMFFNEHDDYELGERASIDLFYENMWVTDEVVSEIRFRHEFMAIGR
jgi:hypothetical protein